MLAPKLKNLNVYMNRYVHWLHGFYKPFSVFFYQNFTAWVNVDLCLYPMYVLSIFIVGFGLHSIQVT